MVPPVAQTTDPQDERFDLYDAQGNPLGVSKPRGEVHRDGDWHRSLHLWVWGIESDAPFVIFQRRSMTKDTWPGVLDVSVGGHFRSGESLVETLREAEEEIGLRVDESEVTRIGRRFHDWRSDTFHDAEISEVYTLRSDLALECYSLHPEEVDGLARIEIEPALALFSGQVKQVPGLEWFRRQGTCLRQAFELVDFVDISDDYAIRTLEAIQTLASGGTPQPFEIRPHT
jgi:isopentenyldiphosphate isomerase